MTLHAVTAASKLGGEVTCLVAGPAGVQGVAKEAATVAGVSKVRVASLYCTVLTVLYCTVLYCGLLIQHTLHLLPQVLVAEHEGFTGFMPERLSPLLVASQDKFKVTSARNGAKICLRSKPVTPDVVHSSVCPLVQCLMMNDLMSGWLKD